ncbi:hypothetical protein AALO_G00151780, partial [Alosa alosa]
SSINSSVLSPSPLEAQLLSGCHSEALFRLAEEQRYAHEYGDTSITHTPPVPTPPLEHPSPAPCSPTTAAGEAMPALNHAVRIPSPPERRQTLAFGDHQSSRPTDPHGNGSASRPERPTASGGPGVGQCAQRPSHSLPDHSPGSRHAKLDLRSMAAVIIQKRWRGYQCRRRKCLPESPEAHGRCSPSVMSKLGMALPKPSDRDHAATVIQAVWRGHALRSRLHRALAAATATEHTGPGDEGLEEVDVDEFVFDEEAVDRDWPALRSDGAHLPKSRQYWRCRCWRTLSGPCCQRHARWLSLHSRTFLQLGITEGTPLCCYGNPNKPGVEARRCCPGRQASLMAHPALNLQPP